MSEENFEGLLDDLDFADCDFEKDERKLAKRNRAKVDGAITTLKRVIFRLRGLHGTSGTPDVKRVTAEYAALEVLSERRVDTLGQQYACVAARLREEIHGCALRAAQMCLQMGLESEIPRILKVSGLPKRTRDALIPMVPQEREVVKYASFTRAVQPASTSKRAAVRC